MTMEAIDAPDGQTPDWPGENCPRRGCAEFHAGTPHTHPVGESAPPTYANRRCCDTPMNQPHTDTCVRRGGRPTTTGPTPTRQAGRHGQIWEDCEAQARADGQTMTAFVAAALHRELDHRRAVAVGAAVITGGVPQQRALDEDAAYRAGGSYPGGT